MDPLPPDVLTRLARDFGDRAEAVTALLLNRRQIGNANYLGDRLVRCVVQAACGDEHRVQQLLDASRQDFRDVIIAGEYDAGGRVRDLRASFLIEGPEAFWAAEVTDALSLRGCRLIALETRPATVGPFVYGADHSEGRATFTGPRGEFVIEKRDRQWTIHGNRRDLEAHELNRAFSDESAFRDAVSGYLLSRLPVPPDEPATTTSKRPWWRFWE